MIGDSWDSKQEIIKKFINKENFLSTLGIDICNINMKIKNYIIQLKIYVPCGTGRYKSLPPSYFRDSNCAISIYDITSRESFEKIDSQLEFWKEYSEPSYVFVFVGKKSNLEEERKVNYDEGKILADKYNGRFYEISNENDQNIDNIFIDSALILFQNYENMDKTKLIEEDIDLDKPINLNINDHKIIEESCC